MNAASTASRAARIYSSRLLKQSPSKTPRRSFAAAQTQASSSEPSRTFSENEFPDRREPPVIKRTRAADSTDATKPKSAKTTRYTISPTRRIGIERPAHVPPNVPLESLEVPDAEITTLSNGVRVGSMENFSQVSSVGVVLDFGSRHELDRHAIPSANETASTAGANHLMELLAFQSTENHSRDEMCNIMKNLGGASYASSSREQMIYCVDALRPNVKEAFNLLGDVIKCPVIEDAEVEEMKRVIEFQTMDMTPQISMKEGLQLAGYGPLDGGKTLQQLGRPHFCTADALPNLTAQSVHAFRERHLLHRPEGIVVSGSGISHDALVELAEANFGHIFPAQTNDDDASRTVPSIYTGGEYRLRRPPDPDPAKEEFTHVAIAFEVGGWHSPDLVPTRVLQTLLGGEISRFTRQGGPGIGIYSRLTQELLSKHGWAESSESFSSFHSESGLWGISGSCKPEKSRELTSVLVRHFLKLRDEFVTDEELDRARNMLKCNVLLALESRLVLFGCIGSDILRYGKREDSATLCAEIDAVTKEDIRDLVRRAIEKPPTLSTVGIDIKKVPKVEVVTQWLREGVPEREKTNFLFR